MEFVKPDEEFIRPSDSRGETKRAGAKPSGSTRSQGSNRMLVGACLKLSQKDREFLAMVGFGDCLELAALPPFADLRRGYKKASLVLHPDKRCGANVDDVELTGPDSSKVSFQDFQTLYQEFIAKFYDVEQQDFNAAVKMHLPRTSVRAKKVGRSK